MKKRPIALLLCVLMVFSLLPLQAFGDGQFAITTSDGASVSAVTINTFEKVPLTASGVQASTVQWQIKYGESWINIAGATQPSLDLGYAMLANLLSGDVAVLRCAAGDVTSGEVVVTVDRAAVPTFDASQESQDVVVLTEAEVIAGDVPSQPSTDPAGETGAEVDLEALYNECLAAQQAVADAESALAASTTAHTAAQAAYDAAAAAEAEALAAYSAAQDSTDALTAYEDAAAYTLSCKDKLDAAAADVAAKTQALADAQAKFDELQTAFALAQNASLMTLEEPEAADEPTPQEDPEIKTYSVVIDYVFTNGDQAANPYTATVAAGSALNTVVSSPKVLGYNPDQETVTLNETNIQENISVTVTYSPAEVSYKVIHHYQNINDDGYDEKEEENKTGLTESQVGDGLEKTKSGFYKLPYDSTITIAADGTTVVDIYYDRYYFLMSFDLDGGYGVEPIYARFGAAIEDVGTPTKAGYTFSKWQSEGADASIPATMPAQNTTYKAVWTLDNTAKVTVVFWGENANDEEYSYDHTGTLQIQAGTEFTYDDETRFVICVEEEHTHDSNCAYACGDNEHVHSDACGYKDEAHSHDAFCYTCGYGNHTHSKECYDNVGNEASPSLPPSNPQNGQIYKGTIIVYSWSYIYINGTWYEYSGNLTDGSIASPTCHTHTDSCLGCGKTEHTHTEDCYLCGENAHTHSDACGYSCGKTAHNHTSACYQDGSGMDTSLWTLVRSETVTVAADGTSIVNVYYDRTQFTLTFHYNHYGNNNYRDTGTITDKWGANISARFLAMNTTAQGNLWSESSGGGSPWTSYLDIMPSENRDYYCRYTSDSAQSAEYYTETLTSGQYELEYTVNAYYDNGTLTISAEDFYPMEGFTYDHGTDGDGGSMPQPGSYGDFDGAKFYYTRNSYKLEFMSSGTKLEDHTATVKFEAPLSTYNFTPPYPDNLEPNAYVFEGWYSDQYFENAVDWTTDKMPASDLMLYAKWVPVTHKVNFYQTSDELAAGNKLYDEQIVSHGSKITPVEDPVRGSYTFIGWFYMDNGVEKAFDIENMPVNKDLDLYGKWSATVMVDYIIRYAVDEDQDGNADVDADGNIIYIAEPTTGKALGATSKTFDAKTGAQLIEGYQSGYFPTTNSHNLEMSLDHSNEYTFLYVPKEEVPYIVRYLEVDTEKVLHEQKNEVTRDAIVTETFVAITGYMPDAYQKRLVLSADESENVITFWYVEDSTHAPLHIVHYTQNISGDGYTVYQESTDINALIGQTYSEAPLTIDGFVHNPDAEGTLMSGTMTAAGLELKLYYDRIEYPYEFHFLEQGTDKVLADPVTGAARYQAQVAQNALPIPGYTLVSRTPQVINIAIEAPADVAKNNIRYFYYQENQVTINYEVVGPAGCGTVSLDWEIIGAKTGEPEGSQATPSSNVYKLVGWYLNEECTLPVPAAQVVDGKFTPVPGSDGLYHEATYYAKFEYNLTSMTITKTAASVYDSEDTFIFDISHGTETFSITLKAGQSVTINNVVVGEVYTVTERTAWSWRYTTQTPSQSLTVTANPAANTITFVNTLANNQWLTDSSVNSNVFSSTK